jgi:hypothetical protein
MSARQNKKQRKGRGNVNRERTVTTLTEAPDTPYLVPTPSEEPAMSSPFSVASSSAGNQQPQQQPTTPFQANYQFGFNEFMHHQQQQQQQNYYPQPMLSLGETDLEILENLKEIIKNNQHECYRPIPQPAALANIYLGPINTEVPSPEITQDLNGGPPSPARPPRMQNKEGTRKSIGIAHNNNVRAFSLTLFHALYAC